MARLSPFAKDREVFRKLAAEHRARAEACEVTAASPPPLVVAPKARSYYPGRGRIFSGFLDRHRRR